MNLGLAAATFAVVLPAELPDKTFISTVLLGTRYRAWPVWIGAATGLVLQALISVVLGHFLGLLPHRAVLGVVAALFLAGAAYLFFIPEKHEMDEAVVTTDEGEELEIGDRAASGISRSTSLRVAATTFGVIGLAEFGDLTQIVIANFSARSHDPTSVFIGASVAFVLISGVGVLAGRTLTQIVPLSAVRIFSGIVLLGLGIWSLVEAIP